MAIDFYELGKRSGAKTKPGRKSGAESLLGSIADNIGSMLAASQMKTAALTAAMPQGVAIDKVPEELRPQVTNFLTENKASYRDATKVLASGINPSSQRYNDAVETINRINSKFQNLSGNLENIALKRQAALDDPSYSPSTSRSDAKTYNDLANGDLYSSMTMKEDGSFNYTSADGESKAFKDFNVGKQSYLGQQGYLGMVENNAKYKKQNKEFQPWDTIKQKNQIQLDALFGKLGPKGQLDYVFADNEFLQNRFGEGGNELTAGDIEDYKDEMRKNPGTIVEDYKAYNMMQLEKEYNNAPGYPKPEPIKTTPTEQSKKTKRTQTKNEFEAFIKPERIQQGNKTTYSYKDPKQVEQYLNNLMPDRTFKNIENYIDYSKIAIK